MVYYRKYRPQTIEELDSKEVRDKLYNVLKSPAVSHAFLFTGPKGLGKTSAARIVAKVLNCIGRKSEIGNQKSEKQKPGSEIQPAKSDLRKVEPCNKCEQCVSITKGMNMDILEIDGASNRGIDEIRDLREKIKLSPLASRKKIYIIDEVHMLTAEAFNALLKTLEEPPAHVVFILCTTEPHKVPGTILSRCLRIQFKKATEEELIRSFARIIKREKLKAELDALRLIANFSDGSFRDGVKILEEMSHLAGLGQAKDKKISKELVQNYYSIASTQYRIAQMIKFLEDKDMKSGLEVIAKLVSEGVEMGHFMQGLIETLHNNLLFKAGVETKAEKSTLMINNLKLEIPEIKRLIELLSEAKSELKYAVLPQLPLELTIVEWGLQAKINTDAKADQGRFPVQRQSMSKSASISDKTIITKKEAEVKTPIITQQDIKNYNENDALWTALIDKVKTYNHSVAGVLRGCKIKSYDGKILLLQTNFKFHKDKLSERKTQEILEKAGKEVTRKNVKIKVVLKGGEK